MLTLTLFTHLNTLVTGACCHALAIEVIGHIVDDVLVICGDILGNKHSLASRVVGLKVTLIVWSTRKLIRVDKSARNDVPRVVSTLW